MALNEARFDVSILQCYDAQLFGLSWVYDTISGFFLLDVRRWDVRSGSHECARRDDGGSKYEESGYSRRAGL